MEFGGAIDGTGNTLGNVITGNGFANVLSGSGGADTLIGGGDNDQLFGGNGLDTLQGGIGDDILDGGAAGDTLIGGAGVDLLTGGVGGDTFQFNLPTEGADVVTDFVSGTDRFAIDNAGFGIAGTGTLAANNIAFVAGSGGDQRKRDHPVQRRDAPGPVGRGRHRRGRSPTARHAGRRQHDERERLPDRVTRGVPVTAEFCCVSLGGSTALCWYSCCSWMRPSP